ncbi:MAG TPA: gluconate 2-dehydrogenase subunit 3 family protein [Polyangiaceae bacterium]
MFTRRVFLRLAAASAAVVALPGCGATPEKAPPGSFFTDPEWRAMNALADVVLPPDDAPGGSALGAATYIDTLMRAFDSNPPLIHAGGPYSGRQPFANSDGTPSANFPENDFKNFIPLSRVADRAWRLRILGSSGVPGGGPNDALLGPVVGLRDLMKQGLAAAIAASKDPIESLTNDQATAIFAQLDATFQKTFAELVVEAAFAVPEYGGNGNLAGWAMIHYAGDIQPLGYSLFDETTSTYVERVPVSTADPGPDLDPMDDDTNAQLTLYTHLLNGRVS